MKTIKENWKLVLIVAAGIVAVIFMCIFGIQGAQNKAFALEEQVNTADSDIKVQEKRRVDLVYNLADCVRQYDKHEAETLTAIASLHAVQRVSYNHFDRVVYHLHSLEQLYSIKRENCSIVRIVFVVTEDFTEDMINRIAVFCANSEDIDELSFRQMVDNHYRETYYCHDYLKAGHKKLWWYIEQNDYNLYYCQNHVYTEYKNIGGDSNG